MISHVVFFIYNFSFVITGITFTALALPETPVLEFNANHPFIYFLQEGNKYPYFIGRFMNKVCILIYLKSSHNVLI